MASVDSLLLWIKNDREDLKKRYPWIELSPPPFDIDKVDNTLYSKRCSKCEQYLPEVIESYLAQQKECEIIKNHRKQCPLLQELLRKQVVKKLKLEQEETNEEEKKRGKNDPKFQPNEWIRLIRVLFRCADTVNDILFSPNKYSFIEQLSKDMKEQMKKTAESASCIFFQKEQVRASKSNFVQESGFCQTSIQWTQGAAYLCKLIRPVCTCAGINLLHSPAASVICRYCCSPTIRKCNHDSKTTCAHRFKHILNLIVDLLRFFSQHKKVFLENMKRWMSENTKFENFSLLLFQVEATHTPDKCVQEQKCLCDHYHCDLQMQRVADEWMWELPIGDFEKMRLYLHDLFEPKVTLTGDFTFV